MNYISYFSDNQLNHLYNWLALGMKWRMLRNERTKLIFSENLLDN